MFLLLSYEYEKLQGNGQHIAAFIATKASLCGEISRLSVDVVESAARKNKKVHKTYWLAFSIHVSDYHNSYFLAGGGRLIMRYMKMRHNFAGVENATLCRIFMSRIFSVPLFWFKKY